MAWNRRVPVSFYRSAAECCSDYIAEEVAKHEEHDDPGSVSELPVYAEEAEIEKKDGEFI